jgi:pimeloyl-ACP methyl ester carboxylesterase
VPEHEVVEVAGGRLAYESVGEGPVVVLSPGMADTRATYRFLAPLLADAGYRAISVDLRGHGGSSTGWSSYSRSDTAGDLIGLIRAIGDGPVAIVGQSFSGGAATIAAATSPDLVACIVEIGPFTRPPRFDVGAFLRNDHHYRTGALLLGRFALSGRVETWAKYLDVAYPGTKPHDWDTWLSALLENLREAGRLDAARGMLKSKPVDAGDQLPNVRCPALIVMGTADSDFADPEAEASAIVDLLPQDLGSFRLIDGAGHYPHAQRPDEVAAGVIPFLREHHHA